jgi:hypothetical protein
LVPEVLVRESEWALVRRLEVSDLIALDRLSSWLLTPRERCEP